MSDNNDASIGATEDLSVDTAVPRNRHRPWQHRRTPVASDFYLSRKITPLAPHKQALEDAQRRVRKEQRRIKRLVAAGKVGEAKRRARKLAISNKAHVAAAPKVLRATKFSGSRHRKPTAYELGSRASDYGVDGGDAFVKAKPKPRGGYRVINDYSLLDKVRQTAVRSAYAPLVSFHHAQFGSDERGTDAALARALAHIQGGESRYGWEGDIQNHYGNVDTATVARQLNMSALVLREVITNQGKEQRNQLKPANWNTHVHWNDINESRADIHPLPQGAAASSLLACGLLGPALEEFGNRWEGRVAMVVYCDNFLLLASDRKVLLVAIASLTELIESIPAASFVLKEKSPVRPLASGIDFLGHRLRKRSGTRLISAQKTRVVRYKDKLDEHIKVVAGRSTTHVCDHSIAVESAAVWAVRHLPTFRSAPNDLIRLMCITLEALMPYRSHASVRSLFRWIERHAPNNAACDANFWGGRPVRSTSAPFRECLTSRALTVPRGHKRREMDTETAGKAREFAQKIARRITAVRVSAVT